MIRGLYTSGWSMLALQKRMDVITNNMANVSTNGYKKDTLVLEGFPSVLTKSLSNYGKVQDIGSMIMGSDVGEVFTNYSQGQLVRTDNALDLAIRDSDRAFFTVSAADTQGNPVEYYTRDGSFTKGSDGVLMTKEGNAVLGMNGLIRLGTGDFTVDTDGTVRQGAKVVDRLRITEFEETAALKKRGDNLVEADPGAVTRVFSGAMEQGATESSNVSIVREMVDMITVMRSYEANQKVLQAQDGTLEKAVNEVGAVR